MASDRPRGSLRKEPFSTKQDLITRRVFEGEINRSYLTQKRFKVTEKNGSHYTILSDKTVEELQAKEKYKGCLITPLI